MTSEISQAIAAEAQIMMCSTAFVEITRLEKERDAALSEVTRITKELAICDECAGKHLERAEKAEADLATLKRISACLCWISMGKDVW